MRGDIDVNSHIKQTTTTHNFRKCWFQGRQSLCILPYSEKMAEEGGSISTSEEKIQEKREDAKAEKIERPRPVWIMFPFTHQMLNKHAYSHCVLLLIYSVSDVGATHLSISSCVPPQSLVVRQIDKFITLLCIPSSLQSRHVTGLHRVYFKILAEYCKQSQINCGCRLFFSFFRNKIMFINELLYPHSLTFAPSYELRRNYTW